MNGMSVVISLGWFKSTNIVSQNLPPMRIILEICTKFGKPFVTHITKVFLFNFFYIGKFGKKNIQENYYH